VEIDMQTENVQNAAGWSVGRSIALELDVVFTIIAGYFLSGGLPAGLMEMIQSLPEDWRAEFLLFIGDESRIIDFMDPLASLAGVIEVGDYSQATLAMRELTLSTALENLVARVSALGVPLHADLPADERLAALMVEEMIAVYGSLGMQIPVDGSRARQLRSDILRATHVLRDGELYARFWHWLDRFYYEFYHPWRLTQIEKMDQMHRRAVIALGAEESNAAVPDISWLPPQSPLLRFPEMRSAVEAGKLHVYFWEEPFGLADVTSTKSGWILVSFADPGEIYKNFQLAAEEIAERTKALADPTRLIILRLIRNFGMINTEIAAYLNLARPTVSVHARILREAGLIRSQQEGREVRHKIEPQEVRRLFHDLERFLDLRDE
jgi:DNA-binding transcriptional ArsR family regulator